MLLKSERATAHHGAHGFGYAPIRTPWDQGPARYCQSSGRITRRARS